MSARYAPVGWNRAKLVYDAVALGAIGLYLHAYLRLGQAGLPQGAALDGQSLAIRAWGSCALLLLTLALAIGPLARLDRRFLPLLYNRRHLGVITAVVAAGHAMQALGWYFAYSPVPAWEAVFVAEATWGQARGFPFIPFGLAALLILAALAATSHDFWLRFLGPGPWKTIHMGIYAAYALAVAHVAFGALQDPRGAGLGILVGGGALALVVLHLLAAARSRPPASPEPAPWLEAGSVDALEEGRGLVVALPGGAEAAVFRWQGRISAISNRCAHQNGPLGEGRVLDGCVTCPWHGFQYRLEDGRAPAPFTERLATYRLRLEGRRILIDPRANPPGTLVEPLAVPAAAP
jgi:nitrite reductase/ring-hydroxylating ferredoxin subunit/DMSO/TMAO reductase YedYZ heme-binding membrane subunit